jgi:hypothetical protein
VAQAHPRPRRGWRAHEGALAGGHRKLGGGVQPGKLAAGAAQRTARSAVDQQDHGGKQAGKQAAGDHLLSVVARQRRAEQGRVPAQAYFAGSGRSFRLRNHTSKP